LFLDHNSDATKLWDNAQRVHTTTKDIETSLQVVENLMKAQHTNGKCEVRLSKVYLPFSPVIVDGQKDSGRMIVEILVYKRSLPDRPHFYLTKRKDEKWFRFFVSQFESLWQDSSVRENS